MPPAKDDRTKSGLRRHAAHHSVMGAARTKGKRAVSKLEAKRAKAKAKEQAWDRSLAGKCANSSRAIVKHKRGRRGVRTTFGVSESIARLQIPAYQLGDQQGSSLLIATHVARKVAAAIGEIYPATDCELTARGPETLVEASARRARWAQQIEPLLALNEKLVAKPPGPAQSAPPFVKWVSARHATADIHPKCFEISRKIHPRFYDWESPADLAKAFHPDNYVIVKYTQDRGRPGEVVDEWRQVPHLHPTAWAKDEFGGDDLRRNHHLCCVRRGQE